MGYVGEHLTLAGGGDYGDETVSRPISFQYHFFGVLCYISKQLSGGDVAWQGLEAKQVSPAP